MSNRDTGEIQAAERSSTLALRPSSSERTPATDNEIEAHLAMLSLFCHHQGMRPNQAKLKMRTIVSDLRGVSEPVLKEACKRYRNSPDRENRFFHLGTLQTFIREENRNARLDAKDRVRAAPPELPPHPCPIRQLPGIASREETPPLAEVLESLAETRAKVPAESVVYLDNVRSKYPPRRIASSKAEGVE